MLQSLPYGGLPCIIVTPWVIAPPRTSAIILDLSTPTSIAPVHLCLFVLFSFYVLRPEGVCRLHKAKETGRRPCVQATAKEIPRPQRALCANLGVWVPLTKERKKEGNEEESRWWFMVTATGPGSALPPPPPPPTLSIHPFFLREPSCPPLLVLSKQLKDLWRPTERLNKKSVGGVEYIKMSNQFY
jgi:hypothetical protein